MGQQTQIERVPFAAMQKAIGKQIKTMSEHRLFRMDIDGDTLWQTYLSSFPEGTNAVYKMRTEHDCSCCRHFIKNVGGMVNITNGQITTIWDIAAEGQYAPVARAMAELVRSSGNVKDVYLHYESLVGNASTRQLLEDKSVKSWDHYYANLPASAVVAKKDIGTNLGEFRATHDVMLRGLTEITLEAIDTVLELIAQNSLYRGEENKWAVSEFRKLKKKFVRLESAGAKDLFVWENLNVNGAVARIRNSAIGTLLTDLSEGKELEDAVKSFESKVAPTNYKRPTALVTKAMIERAQKTVNDLGLTTALERRYATLDDLTINNLLFADRATKRQMNVFDNLASANPVDTKKLGKVEEISIADFVSKVLPTAQTVEVLFENRHTGNMVSLVAPVDPTAKQLFKWTNGFSWSYKGDLADSIKERVKRAGGSVTGDYRASLAWYNYDDLDLHLTFPNGHIFFGNKREYSSGGNLDVDMNAGTGTTRTPVENIVFPKKERMVHGDYVLSVNNYAKRESVDVGFEVEMEFDGKIYNFAYPKDLRANAAVDVCRFRYSTKGIEIVKSLPSSQTSKSVWNLSTQAFHKVQAVMLSPNCWDGFEVGNKHYFFMLENCQNEETARGFFNEFLHEELSPHRKVLEMVGARMRTDETDQQLSGIGFSSTHRNSLVCRVTGTFTRTIKVLF